MICPSDQGPPLPRLAVYLCYVVLSTISLTKVPTKMVELTCTNGGFTSKKLDFTCQNWKIGDFTDLSHRKIGMS